MDPIIWAKIWFLLNFALKNFLIKGILTGQSILFSKFQLESYCYECIHTETCMFEHTDITTCVKKWMYPSPNRSPSLEGIQAMGHKIWAPPGEEKQVTASVSSSMPSTGIFIPYEILEYHRNNNQHDMKVTVIFMTVNMDSPCRPRSDSLWPEGREDPGGKEGREGLVMVWWGRVLLSGFGSGHRVVLFGGGGVEKAETQVA